MSGSRIKNLDEKGNKTIWVQHIQCWYTLDFWYQFSYTTREPLGRREMLRGRGRFHKAADFPKY